MKTIALVAEKGAGKGLFVEIIKRLMPDKRIVSVRFSDVLCDILDILGKEKSRHNISTLATVLRDAFQDEGLLTSVMRTRLQGMDADIVFLDGLRKEKEISLVRERDGLLVYIAADARIRFERSSQRAEKSDEMGMTWEQFNAQEQMATEVSIRNIGETLADVKLENNGTVEEFERVVKSFIARHGF